MKPYYDDGKGIVIWNGDCRDVMAGIDAESIDAIVTDPPYGLGFMGVKWDTYGDGKGRAPSKNHDWDKVGGNSHARKPGGIELIRAKENRRYQAFMQGAFGDALRVAKPGAYLLAFGGTRTFHRLTCAIEDAGWEIRDCIMWVYGSGFPKSLDVSKAVDKAAGAERQVVGIYRSPENTSGRSDGSGSQFGIGGLNPITAPATDAARQWDGWGTALKPSYEPIIVARKPLAGTVAANVQRYGTGAINIGACRVGTSGGGTHCGHRDDSGKCLGHANAGRSTSGETFHGPDTNGGRWPANLIHDGSDEVLALFPQTTAGVAVRHRSGGNTFGGEKAKPPLDDMGYGDSGSAARFFYTAKASRSERGKENTHPTIKPLSLMRYLCRLVTPPEGVVLDPFAGTCTTGRAAALEGFRFVGVELEEEHCRIAVERFPQSVLPL